jgi:hypothetical protein
MKTNPLFNAKIDQIDNRLFPNDFGIWFDETKKLTQVFTRFDRLVNDRHPKFFRFTKIVIVHFQKAFSMKLTILINACDIVQTAGLATHGSIISALFVTKISLFIGRYII